MWFPSSCLLTQVYWELSVWSRDKWNTRMCRIVFVLSLLGRRKDGDEAKA
jgi:hypothetical protein